MLNMVLENTLFVSFLGVNSEDTSTLTVWEENLMLNDITAYLYFDAVLLLSVTASTIAI